MEIKWVAKGVRTVNGVSTDVWLQRSGRAEIECYSGWGASFSELLLFDSKQEALNAAVQCPGPWYNEPAKGSIEALEVEYAPPQPKIIVLKRKS
jgi:hypothetical protein